MEFKKLTYSSLTALALSGATFAASASIISFDQRNVPDGERGEVTYGGAGGPLLGTDIVFDSISASDVPDNGGVILDCDGCSLDFTTGANQQEGSPGGGVTDPWIFAGGETTSFTLNGTVLAPGGELIASGLLLGGHFTGQPFVTSGDETSLSFKGAGIDDKNDNLLAYFGLEPGTPFEFASTVISLDEATFTSNGGFTGSVTDADLDNERTIAAVPEPEELGLFALGVALLGMGMAFRRTRGWKAQV